jgi:hypothetical protein
MLYREIIAVFSEIHTKHINTLCGQNVEFLNIKLAVHIVTTGLLGLIIRNNMLLELFSGLLMQTNHSLYNAILTFISFLQFPSRWLPLFSVHSRHRRVQSSRILTTAHHTFSRISHGRYFCSRCSICTVSCLYSSNKRHKFYDRPVSFFLTSRLWN